MLKNYIKIAYRNLVKHPGFSLINLFGLSVGMTCCVLIFLYINHELSYDKFHTKAPQIYRLVTDVKTPTEVIKADITSAPMAPNLKATFPEVLEAVRFNYFSFLVQRGDNKWQEKNALLADAAVFKVFDFPLIKGNPETALKAPFSLVLTETVALKYFGAENPIGQSLKIDGEYNGTVTGVIKDAPENSQLKFDILVSMTTLTETLNPGQDEQWGNFVFSTYLLLPEDYNAKQLEAKLPDFMDAHISQEMQRNGMDYTLFLEPLTDVYLLSDRNSQESGSLINVYIFAAVAVLILAIACFNFMNLAIARSVDRAREVGVRKVIGAARNQLTWQFLSESALMSILSGIIAFVLAQALLPLFNHVSGKFIAENIFINFQLYIIVFLLTLFTGLVAGVYPAMMLSKYNPSVVLKGRAKPGSGGLSLRKALVVVQFAMSVILIVGTLVVYQQLDFMKSMDLGFQKDQVVVFDFQGDPIVTQRYEVFKNEIARIPGVANVAASGSTPSTGNASAYTLLENQTGEMQASNIALYFVDFDYLDNYKIPILAGRGFSSAHPSDSIEALVVNEATVASLGYANPEDIIGKKFSQWGRDGQVIGVIKDFHYQSLKEKIGPLTMRIEPQNFRLFSVAIDPINARKTVSEIEDYFKDVVPSRPVDYYFLDEAFDNQYRADERFGSLILYFSGIAIFIACLGLLGITSYTTTQRSKEVGIRKVMGATTLQVVNLLSVDLIKLVAIGIIIATPVAWYGMTKWLENFQYKMSLSFWVFVIAALLAGIIALLTVGSQAIKAALANPVDSLKND